MATSIYGISYGDIISVITNSPETIYANVDAGSFADDGNDPPQAYTYTGNAGAWIIAGQYSSILGVVANAPE
jgi:hypothetical protein